MKIPPKVSSVGAKLKQCLDLVVRLERRTAELRRLLPAATGHGESHDRVYASHSKQAALDRFQWGYTVAHSLAPKFDSREFSRAFRAALPPESLLIFDSVRLKKVLQQLCREQIIQMSKPGRGRTPAQYRVLPRARD